MRFRTRKVVTWIEDNLLKRLREVIMAKYPRVIVMEGVVDSPLRFRVYSSVERYRIEGFGGERAALEYFLETLNPNDIVYDIGASVGLYTVLTAAVLSQGMVYAFEPDPNTRARLAENIHLNQLDNVRLMKWAVGDSERDVTLYSDGAAGLAPSLVFQQAREDAPEGKEQVSMQSLDIALSRGDLIAPDILKIDIEGAEELCLRGSTRLLKGEFDQRPRMIFLELHPNFLPNFGSSVKNVKSILKNLGYEMIWTQKRNNQRHVCYVTES